MYLINQTMNDLCAKTPCIALSSHFRLKENVENATINTH